MSKRISGMQKAFNKAVRALREQGCRSMAVLDKGCDAGCAYRGDNNTRCAFGHLIPNKLYKKNMEGKFASTVIDTSEKVKNHMNELYPGATENFFNALQAMHDDVRYWNADFECNVSQLAVKYKLKIPK